MSPAQATLSPSLSVAGSPSSTATPAGATVTTVAAAAPPPVAATPSKVIVGWVEASVLEERRKTGLHKASGKQRTSREFFRDEVLEISNKKAEALTRRKYTIFIVLIKTLFYAISNINKCLGQVRQIF